MKVAIFPGHVGKDPGAIDAFNDEGISTIEAVINGQVAVLLKHHLDMKLIPSEIYIGAFKDRIQNSKDCTIGISLHCDASVSQQANGFSIFHYPSSVKGQHLATHVQNAMNGKLQGLINCRGIFPKNFYILRKTAFPCILLEMGFITNPSEEEILNRYHTQNRIAYGLSLVFKSIGE